MKHKVIFLDKDFEKEIVNLLPMFPPRGADLNELIYFITINHIQRKGITEENQKNLISIKELNDKEA